MSDTPTKKRRKIPIFWIIVVTWTVWIVVVIARQHHELVCELTFGNWNADPSHSMVPGPGWCDPHW